jgi:hypothetical protein
MAQHYSPVLIPGTRQISRQSYDSNRFLSPTPSYEPNQKARTTCFRWHNDLRAKLLYSSSIGPTVLRYVRLDWKEGGTTCAASTCGNINQDCRSGMWKALIIYSIDVHGSNKAMGFSFLHRLLYHSRGCDPADAALIRRARLYIEKEFPGLHIWAELAARKPNSPVSHRWL